MEKQTKMKSIKKKIKKINWWDYFLALFTLTLWAVIMAIIGMSLPETINQINNTTTYGHFVSYFIVCFLYWLITRDVNFVKEEKHGK